MGGSSASENVIIDNAISYVGESAHISIERETGSFQFDGIITSVHIDQQYAGDAFIIFSGYSPTFLLDGQLATTTFEDQDLNTIFNTITSDLPANLKKKSDPEYKSKISYITQYRESGYAFISRLAMQYSEWFYYDGQGIVFGKLPEGEDPIELMFGGDSMLYYNYGINVRPTKTTRKFYKYQENKVLDQPVSSFQPGWLNPHGKTALKVSEELFPKEEVEHIDHDTLDQTHLRTLSEAEKSGNLSDALTFSGQSSNPAVKIGAEVKLKSRNGFIGQYRIVSVIHTVDSHQDYNNSFDAISSVSPVPPINGRIILPKAETQIAEVIENEDPDGLGRVRIRFKWQEGLSPWLRVLTSDAGGEHGHYFTPEIGDEVLVDFEGGNPDRPFIVGSKYHGKIPPPFFDKENNLKAIKTRSGHTLLFDDKSGKESITISDKNGNTIKLDTSGKSISISSSSSVTVSSQDITISAGKSVTINGGEEITVNTKTYTVNAESSTINGTSEAKVDSSGSTLSLTPKDGKITSKKLDVNGDTMVTVTGGTIKLN